MRGAPWVLWIQDLSIPDPYYILPIIMAISMFVQTKLNPTPPDPIQAKVLGHVKDDKVIVFKKKRRKRYQSRNGHRQQMTQIEIISL